MLVSVLLVVHGVPPVLHACINSGGLVKAVNAKDVGRVVVPLVSPRSDDLCNKALPAVLYGRLDPVPPGLPLRLGPLSSLKVRASEKQTLLSMCAPGSCKVARSSLTLLALRV